MRSKPRQIVVDGKPMIAVSAKEFESLLAMRRQLGSQTSKMRILRDALVDMTEFLDALAEELDADAPPEPQESLPTPDVPLPRMALIGEIQRRARQVRAITGAGRRTQGRRSTEQPQT
ncbi:hypothetical protein ACIRBZ_44745 [Streptomyces sp. NPDC094038]|uniref:hypothetical protein n=1 Tax=Streptomyces sp. NPDC094038 TaxID=3366055 RepID=UPI0038060320